MRIQRLALAGITAAAITACGPAPRPAHHQVPQLPMAAVEHAPACSSRGWPSGPAQATAVSQGTGACGRK